MHTNVKRNPRKFYTCYIQGKQKKLEDKDHYQQNVAQTFKG